MADWRQIQARIRKAKNAPDAHVKLSDLYARTHDAMVAWELATIEEKAERNSEAVKWYTLSAERFRRPEWKKRAEEALVRLGAPVPQSQPQMDFPTMKPDVEENTEAFHIPATPEESGEDDPQAADDNASDAEAEAESDETDPTAASGAADAVDSEAQKKKRRRGRRGGRGRRKKVDAETARPSPVVAEAGGAAAPTEVRPKPSVVPPVAPIQRGGVPIETAKPILGSSIESSEPTPAKTLEMPVRRPALERSAQGRTGDPALASRMAQLESMLRRLVASTAHKLDEADDAPAGPGVFLLSDSDQVTSYYVESCQTLRVAVGNLVRGGRGNKSPRTGRNFGEEDLKAKLAEHLGINESKVAQYMKEHCVIRWIQLDDDAAHLAHFAIGVLRTPLNVI